MGINGCSNQENEKARKAQSEHQAYVAEFSNMIDRMADVERVNAELKNRDAERGISVAQRLSNIK